MANRPQILVKYTNCPHEHNHDVPHDCLYDLECCGLFEPSGPSGSPESLVCAACHSHRNSHRIVMVPHEIASSPPRPYYQAHRLETFMRLAPPPPPPPQPAYEPGPSVTRLTKERSDRLRAIAKRNNYRMFKEYPKSEVAQICAELGIKRRCLKDWISRHNLSRQRAAARQAAARQAATSQAAAASQAAADCCVCQKCIVRV